MGPQIIEKADGGIEIVIDHDHPIESPEQSEWLRNLEKPDEGEQYHPDNA